MEPFYTLLFAILSGAILLLEWPRASTVVGVKAATPAALPPAFVSFRNNYLVVYSLMMAGDWLQGPYVYALYAGYGFSKGDIGKLFIAGFGSSMVFGTVVGSLADKHGRKNASLLYCVTYTASCVTKHWNNFKVLMLGRLLGGIATSLLFTAFEAWLVSEHTRRGFEPGLLSGTFSKAVFLGNGLVAIVAGLVANSLVGYPLELGPVSPFDAAACCLTLGGAIIAASWTENYGGGTSKKLGTPSANDDSSAPDGSSAAAATHHGDGAQSGDLDGMEEPHASNGASSTSSGLNAVVAGVVGQFRRGAKAISGDPRVGLLGAMQSLFEASMYSFVFLWTPALSPGGEDIPHGMIFATFMLSCMIGSSVASRLLARTDTRPEVFMQRVFAVAACALATPVLVFVAGVNNGSGEARPGAGMTLAGKLQFVAFNLFEGCVGVFWPSMMKMRAQYVPEELRSTIMNMFRMPLNLFVCVILYNVSLFPLWFMFSMCVLFLYAAALAQRRLERMTAHAHAEQMAGSDGAGAGADAGA